MHTSTTHRCLCAMFCFVAAWAPGCGKTDGGVASGSPSPTPLASTDPNGGVGGTMPENGQVYILLNAQSGKALDITNPNGGSSVRQADIAGTVTQLWRVSLIGNQQLTLTNLDTNSCLSFPSQAVSGEPLHVSACGS